MFYSGEYDCTKDHHSPKVGEQKGEKKVTASVRGGEKKKEGGKKSTCHRGEEKKRAGWAAGGSSTA